MSDVAIFHIAVALNINFDHVKGLRDNEICRKFIF